MLKLVEGVNERMNGSIIRQHYTMMFFLLFLFKIQRNYIPINLNFENVKFSPTLFKVKENIFENNLKLIYVYIAWLAKNI